MKQIKLNWMRLSKNCYIFAADGFHTETANIIQENEIEDELLNSFADYVLSGGIFGSERDDSVRRLRKGVAEDGNNGLYGSQVTCVSQSGISGL